MKQRAPPITTGDNVVVGARELNPGRSGHGNPSARKTASVKLRLPNTEHKAAIPGAAFPEQAKQLTAAGADIVVAHMRLTTSGTIGAKVAFTLEDSVRRVGEVAEAAFMVPVRWNDCPPKSP